MQQWHPQWSFQLFRLSLHAIAFCVQLEWMQWSLIHLMDGNNKLAVGIRQNEVDDVEL